MSGSIINLFIDEAGGIKIADCVADLGLPTISRNGEYAGPCPQCGGKDRFSYNIRKDVWNCRGCAKGGHGALSLAAHVLGLDLHIRADLIKASETVLGRTAPQNEVSDEEHLKAKWLFEQRQKKASASRAKADAAAKFYREKEQRLAREKWQAGRLLQDSPFNAYLAKRCGGAISSFPLRLLSNEPYYFNDGGSSKIIYEGPAMVAPFINSDRLIIGCHLTWLDLNNPPKYRPIITAPQSGEVLPTKKMRGSKKGGLIPLSGFVFNRDGYFKPRFECKRMVVGEGIETVLALRLAEGLRNDTIYAAAGDLGNLCGPADPASRFAHPSQTMTDSKGRVRRVFVAGDKPLMSDAASCIFVPDWINELVLIADGDSERVMTAAAIVRAKLRFSKPNRRIIVVWPPRGCDVADMMAVEDER
ncbi:hypothetical protein N5853_09310 [Bartonella sp. HY329]|uniref:DUF7146 domain-containing protein n=1 Tax=unclassified Bartonella TaxID=2645622 RepID=UPI0021C89C40|nr:MULTISPECIES: primase-helicase zinc-binding domain-containing protein [unclassified Bartonella]UXM94304.1 hypothetical protein N5853_09310 [Bartonella sp. HY329]UXN08627.1 hypothetical protein N5852_09320 [Bartonella sp. HY328]